MMTQEQNDELTRVGPGTPMGDVLRHYWYPVALVRELDEFPVKKARLLGEDFAVFKLPDGTYGITHERCPHRGASLVYGIVEDGGLRCGYHGWKFDVAGKCVDILAQNAQLPCMIHTHCLHQI
jgi:5,5'-dehydrodivanillate O-demethylase